MTRLALVPVAVAAVVFGKYVTESLAVNDEAYITYRYARNLALGHGLTYNVAGPLADSASSPLHTLLLAIVYRIGWTDLPLASHLIALGALGAAAFFLFRLADQIPLGRPLTAGLVLSATSVGPVLGWALGGLETLPFTAAIYGTLYAVSRGSRAWSMLGVVCVVALRPEGVLLAVALAAALLFAGRSCRTADPASAAATVAIGAGALTFMALSAWRLAYYGSLMSTAALLKVNFAYYQPRPFFVTSLLLQSSGVLLFSAAGGGAVIVWDALRRRVKQTSGATTPLVLFALAFWVCSHLLICLFGPTSEWLRYPAPVIPGFALLAAVVLSRATSVAAGRAARRAIAIVALVGCVAAALQSVRSLIEYDRIFHVMASHQRARTVLGTWMRDHLPPRATVLSSDVGAVGWYSEAQILDALGLVSPEVLQARLSDGSYGEGTDGVSRVFAERPRYIADRILSDDGPRSAAEYWLQTRALRDGTVATTRQLFRVASEADGEEFALWEVIWRQP